MTESEPVKRARGRPKKHPPKAPGEKRSRGRPRKDHTAIKAVDMIFEQKYKSIREAACDLLPEYPGMARAASMTLKARRQEPSFEKLADKIRLELTKRLARSTPEQSINFPLHVFRLMAPTGKRRLSQAGPKAQDAKQSREELREIINWLDDRKAQRRKRSKSRK
jgi:AT hook motif